MTTDLENQLRHVLRDAPEPDWHAFRRAIEERAGHQRRVRMLRGSLGGLAAAAAVAAIAVAAASSSLFDGSRALPAVTPTSSTSPTSDVPESTAFQPLARLANGSYRVPIVFGNLAPAGSGSLAGTTVRPDFLGTSTFANVGAAICLRNAEAAAPQPWGGTRWDYLASRSADGPGVASLTAAGWPQGTARRAMTQLGENSGACTLDQTFDVRPWPGLAADEGRQFVVDAALDGDGEAPRASVARRHGDVILGAWVTVTGDEAEALATARQLVDEGLDTLVASDVLDAPTPGEFAWPGGMREAAPDTTAFVLPRIAPDARTLGVTGLVAQRVPDLSDMGTVPVLGATIGDPTHPGASPIATRTTEYGVGQGGEGKLYVNLTWSAFEDGPAAFDAIVANRGAARWAGPTTRESWRGHDTATTFLARQSGDFGDVAIALRLEGDVLIAAVGQGGSATERRALATTLADRAATNLARFGRGPDGRPGNGR